MPYFIIQSSKPKCVKLEVPHDTLLQIFYDTPDLFTKDRKKEEGPVTIKISQVHTVGHRAEKSGRSRPIKISPITTDVKKATGKIMHKVKEDGELVICVTVKNLSNKHPVRFGLQVMPGRDTAHYHQEQMEHHLSNLQNQIMRLIDENEGILAEADYAKEREKAFHEKIVTMHSSAQMWPILHICLLLLTGVMQGLHMVRFFQTKRLI